MKVDILAIGAHPDDIELSCSGTLLKHIDLGYTVGLLDLTRGEMGTRGTPELRLKEAANAAKMMGAEFRKNLRMADGFFERTKENKLKIVEVIREHQPDIVLANALHDRHIDHGRGAQIVIEACFLSGLQKIETIGSDGKAQSRWRPKAIYHYIQDKQLTPDIAVDISAYIERKIELILAFRSQFFDPDSKELETPLTRSDFFDLIKGKNKTFGRDTNYEYAEGFNVTRVIGVEDLVKLD
ncbi:MAG: bacillithiol biosynthesis deacetylase BshB1 [Bacteroidota bacterium]